MGNHNKANTKDSNTNGNINNYNIISDDIINSNVIEINNNNTNNNNNKNKNNNNENNDNEGNGNDGINASDTRNFIWIDKEVNNKENTFIFKHLFESKNIKCEKCENIDEGFNYLNKKEFKDFIIIISSKLINGFYHLLKDNINSIKISPTIIIFCREKDKVIKNLKQNNIYYNNYLFNTKFIYNKASEIEDLINNKTETEEEDLSFDLIENNEQLIIPKYYTYFLDDATIFEINYFNDYLFENFKPDPKIDENIQKKQITEYENDNLEHKKIHELLAQIKYKILPKQIIIKYWLRIYTLQTSFFKKLNKSFRTKSKQINFYFPFIKLCYEAVKKEFIVPNTQEMYRCSNLSMKEFEEIEKRWYLKKKRYYDCFFKSFFILFER